MSLRCAGCCNLLPHVHARSLAGVSFAHARSLALVAPCCLFAMHGGPDKLQLACATAPRGAKRIGLVLFAGALVGLLPGRGPQLASQLAGQLRDSNS